MKLWKILHRATLTGSAAAFSSALVAARLARSEGASIYAPLNAVTHCLWPRTAFFEQRPSVRYTATGAGVHWGSSIFWGVLFEALRGAEEDPARIVNAAVLTVGVAYVVDYHVVPQRVTPGFEAHIPRSRFGWIYGALTLGLSAAAMVRAKR